MQNITKNKISTLEVSTVKENWGNEFHHQLTISVK